MCKELNKDFRSDKDLLNGIYNAISTYVNHTGKVQCYNAINGDSDADVGLDSTDAWYIQVRFLISENTLLLHRKLNEVILPITP